MNVDLENFGIDFLNREINRNIISIDLIRQKMFSMFLTCTMENLEGKENDVF